MQLMRYIYILDYGKILCNTNGLLVDETHFFQKIYKIIHDMD